jgi:hypothetical protein
MSQRLDTWFRRHTPHFLAGIGCVPVVAIILVSLMDHPLYAGAAFAGLLLWLGSYLSVSGQRIEEYVREDDYRRDTAVNGVLHEVTGPHRVLHDHGRHSS